MNASTSVKFRLLDGWTVRKVAAALAREWLPPILAKTGPKAPRWLLQPVVEVPPGNDTQLWEAGISTEEYERRLENTDLSWVIRANVARGRGKGNVLARLAMEEADTIVMNVYGSAVPESLFDQSMIRSYLKERSDDDGDDGIDGLFVGLVADAGFNLIAEEG